MTIFQKGVLIIAGIVMVGIILYPPYKEEGINRGYASLFKYPTKMKRAPKYDCANEFYNFSDEQVRVPDKIYTSSSVNPIALSIQLAGVLIISSVLWVLGKASYPNKTVLEEYSRFNRILSVTNVLWFFGIIFGLTLPYMISADAPDANYHALLQLITIVTPILTILALHPQAGLKLRQLVVMQNIIAALYLYHIFPFFHEVYYFLMFILLALIELALVFIVQIIFGTPVLFILLFRLTIVTLGAINALALLILVIRNITNKPSAGA